jgi:hypothetical protein
MFIFYLWVAFAEALCESRKVFLGGFWVYDCELEAGAATIEYQNMGR